MQQISRSLKVDTTQQREVVPGLQQSKMTLHRCGGVPSRKVLVPGEPTLQFMLKFRLAGEERVKQRKLFRLNGARSARAVSRL